MSILQTELPDEQLQIISEQARAQGYEDNAQYLLAFWRANADQQNYMDEQGLTPEQLKREEQMLLESLDGEPEVADDAWWAKLHADVMAEVDAKKRGKEARNA